MNRLVWLPSLTEDPYRNMARDVALMESGLGPAWLRFYRWTKPAVSIGFSQQPSAIPGWPECDFPEFVRRPTGGGVVYHQGESDFPDPSTQFTYSAFFSAETDWGKLTSTEFYCRLHHRLACGLKAANPSQAIALVKCADERNPGVCFQSPVPADLICETSGQKLAGAGLRRTRHGILCQGQIQIPKGWTFSPATWIESWSDEFAVEKQNDQRAIIPDSILLDLEKQLSSPLWLEKRKRTQK